MTAPVTYTLSIDLINLEGVDLSGASVAISRVSPVLSVAGQPTELVVPLAHPVVADSTGVAVIDLIPSAEIGEAVYEASITSGNHHYRRRFLMPAADARLSDLAVVEGVVAEGAVAVALSDDFTFDAEGRLALSSDAVQNELPDNVVIVENLTLGGDLQVAIDNGIGEIIYARTDNDGTVQHSAEITYIEASQRIEITVNGGDDGLAAFEAGELRGHNVIRLFEDSDRVEARIVVDRGDRDGTADQTAELRWVEDGGGGYFLLVSGIHRANLRTGQIAATGAIESTGTITGRNLHAERNAQIERVLTLGVDVFNYSEMTVDALAVLLEANTATKALVINNANTIELDGFVGEHRSIVMEAAFGADTSGILNADGTNERINVYRGPLNAPVHIPIRASEFQDADGTAAAITAEQLRARIGDADGTTSGLLSADRYAEIGGGVDYTRWLHRVPLPAGSPDGAVAVQPTSPWDMKSLLQFYPDDPATATRESRLALQTHRKFIAGDVYASSNGDDVIDGVTWLGAVARGFADIDQGETQPVLLANSVFELAAGTWEIEFDMQGNVYGASVAHLRQVRDEADDVAVISSIPDTVPYGGGRRDDATAHDEEGDDYTIPGRERHINLRTGPIKLAAASRFYVAFTPSDSNETSNNTLLANGTNAANARIAPSMSIKRLA